MVQYLSSAIDYDINILSQLCTLAARSLYCQLTRIKPFRSTQKNWKSTTSPPIVLGLSTLALSIPPLFPASTNHLILRCWSPLTEKALWSSFMSLCWHRLCFFQLSVCREIFKSSEFSQTLFSIESLDLEFQQPKWQRKRDFRRSCCRCPVGVSARYTTRSNIIKLSDPPTQANTHFNRSKSIESHRSYIKRLSECQNITLASDCLPYAAISPSTTLELSGLRPSATLFGDLAAHSTTLLRPTILAVFNHERKGSTYPTKKLKLTNRRGKSLTKAASIQVKKRWVLGIYPI